MFTGGAEPGAPTGRRDGCQLALVGWECGSQEVGVEVLTEGEWQEVGFA